MAKAGVVDLDLLFLSSAALTCAHYLINISPNILANNFQKPPIRHIPHQPSRYAPRHAPMQIYWIADE